MTNTNTSTLIEAVEAESWIETDYKNRLITTERVIDLIRQHSEGKPAVDEDELLDRLAALAWSIDYPRGGSIYRTYESTPFHDKELYRNDLRPFLDVVRPYLRAPQPTSQPAVEAQGDDEELFDPERIETVLNNLQEIHTSAFVNGERVSKEQRDHMERLIYRTAISASALIECLRDLHLRTSQPAVEAQGVDEEQMRRAIIQLLGERSHARITNGEVAVIAIEAIRPYLRTPQPKPPEDDATKDWQALAETWANEFLSHIAIPGAADKDKSIRPALHAFILANKLFERFVKLGVEIGESQPKPQVRTGCEHSVDSSNKCMVCSDPRIAPKPQMSEEVARAIFRLGFKAGGGIHSMDEAFLFEINKEDALAAMQAAGE